MNMYVDLLSTNVENYSTKPSVFKYSTQSNSTIIDNPSQYQLSIVRFQVDSSTAPVFMPAIQPNQPDINLTTYSVTLSIRELTSGPVYVRWRPMDKTAMLPMSPSNGLADYSTGYYFCYSYNWWCMLVLEAYETALGLLRNSDVDIIDEAIPPLFYWNNGSSAAVILAQTEFYDMGPNGPENCIEIYMNQSLYSLFNSFPATFESYASPFGQNYRILCYRVASINTDLISLADGSEVECISVPQEFSTTLAWSPFVSIVFTSSTIPVLGSITMPAQITIDDRLDYSTSQLSATELIVTDLVSNDGVYRSSLTYEPNAQYRYIDLYGNQALTEIDMSIYWRTKLGTLIPFRLGSGGTVSVKLGFFKK